MTDSRDYIIKAIDDRNGILAYAARTTGAVEEARRIHGCSPTATAALGRLLTAVGMMGLMLKGENQNVTIRINGGGPAGTLLAFSDEKARVKGYIGNPAANLLLNQKGKLDVGGIVGRDGNLTVVKDLGLKEPYVGQVPLVSGEIAEDLALYFARSEQIPSAVALGVLVDTDGSVKASGGFIIQLLPGADEKAAQAIEGHLASMGSVTGLIESGMTPEDILRIVLKDYELKFTDRADTEYYCGCGRERLENVIISMGMDEIKDILKEEHGIELRCNFCNKKYWFGDDEIEKLLKSAQK